MPPSQPAFRVATRPKRAADPAERGRALTRALGIASIASSALLLFGALQRANFVNGPSFLWEGWAGAPAAVRFVVVLAVMVGLLGCGGWAMGRSWRKSGHIDLLASCAFLLAGVSLLVGATHNRQWGASEAVPMVLMACIAVVFVGVLVSAWRRYTQAKPDAPREGDGTQT